MLNSITLSENLCKLPTRIFLYGARRKKHFSITRRENHWKSDIFQVSTLSIICFLLAKDNSKFTEAISLPANSRIKKNNQKTFELSCYNKLCTITDDVQSWTKDFNDSIVKGIQNFASRDLNILYKVSKGRSRSNQFWHNLTETKFN